MNVGLKFGLSLIKEIYDVSPQMMEAALKHLYQALCESPAQGLFGTDLLAFQQDQTLNDARDYLL